jgi:hypothetical protein
MPPYPGFPGHAKALNINSDQANQMYFWGKRGYPGAFWGIDDVPEPIVAGEYSVTCCISPQGNAQGAAPRTVTWTTSFQGQPSAMEIDLLGNMVDNPVTAVKIDDSTNTNGEVRVVGSPGYRFYWAYIKTITGGTSVAAIVTMAVNV